MKKLLLIFTVLGLVLTAGCAQNTPPEASAAPGSDTASGAPETPGYNTIEPKDVKEMLDNGDDFILVDVRTVEEFTNEHIDGAINIPVETIGGTKPAELPDLDVMIVVYCRTGNRTVTAAKALVALGYTRVFDMGGIVDWPYETVTTGPEAPAEPSEAPPASPSDSTPPPESADAASTGILSNFSATDIDDNFITASIWEGHKLTMVNIWATFCGPCIQEMPGLGKLSAAYQDKGVQIVGIVADASDSSGAPIPDMVSLARQIVTLTGADYPHILASSDLNDLLLNDVTAVPTTLFVDEKGNQVGEMYLGARLEDAWAAIIEDVLEEVD